MERDPDDDLIFVSEFFHYRHKFWTGKARHLESSINMMDCIPVRSRIYGGIGCKHDDILIVAALDCTPSPRIDHSDHGYIVSVFQIGKCRGCCGITRHDDHLAAACDKMVGNFNCILPDTFNRTVSVGTSSKVAEIDDLLIRQLSHYFFSHGQTPDS